METVKKKVSVGTIDEQLAEANKEFEARMAAEGKRILPKPEAKVLVRPRTKAHRVGDVAHTHFNETDFEIVENDCLYVNHTVRDRKGFTINGKRYQGKVVVAKCVADYLSMMENKHIQMEHDVFQDRGRKISYGEIRG